MPVKLIWEACLLVSARPSFFQFCIQVSKAEWHQRRKLCRYLSALRNKKARPLVSTFLIRQLARARENEGYRALVSQLCDPMKSREDVSGSYHSSDKDRPRFFFSRGREINQRARSLCAPSSFPSVLTKRKEEKSTSRVREPRSFLLP